MSKNVHNNNKRILHNTLLLYVRMLFIMVVSLYTSRVILNCLGVEDYGIYNVVGGVVAMMGMLNSAMSSSTTRYLTYELGRGDTVKLSQTFSMCLQIYILVSILFVIVAETIGLWFLNTQLVIPYNRIAAANWVYQFSIISVVNQLLLNPYNASIIAHERMGIYAYVSIIDAILRLIIVYLLLIIPFDSLISYGLMVMIISISVTLIYRIYCIRNFNECHYRYNGDKVLFKQLISYSGWNLFGSVAAFVKGQGLNILINVFFNPSVNAARGIAYQINTAVYTFINNFYTAVKPQITKYYAQGDLFNMQNLVFKSSIFSFYLILILALPIIIETPQIIKLWLGQLPEYVIPFVRLIIVISAVDGIASPLMTVAHATGKIALYQGLVGTATILIIPISYFTLKMGGSPVSVFVVSLIVAILCLFLRLFIVKRLVNFPFWKYTYKVFLKALFITGMSLPLPLYIHVKLDDSFESLCISVFACLLNTLLIIYYVGLEKNEKRYILRNLKNKIGKK